MTAALGVKLLVKKQPEHEIRVKLAEWATGKSIRAVCTVLSLANHMRFVLLDKERMLSFYCWVIFCVGKRKFSGQC